MREIGKLPTEAEARVFSDHLVALGMRTRVDARPDGHAVWVYHDDHVPQARREFEEFQREPQAERYRESSAAARERRLAEERADRAYRKNHVDLRTSRSYGNPIAVSIRTGPVTSALIAISIVVYLMMNGGPRFSEVTLLLVFSPPVLTPDGIAFAGIEPILSGQVWRLLTPIFLHFGVMHILFNLVNLYVIGRLVEARRGSGFMLAFVAITGVASNIGEYVLETQILHRLGLFGGMSGVVYALFGYIWVRGVVDPTQGFRLAPISVQIMVLWLVLGVVGYIPHIANGAHVVGLLLGMLAGLSRV